MRTWFWVAVAAGLGAVSLFGCGEDEPEQCGYQADGEFYFALSPRLPSGPDSTADIERTITDAVLDTIVVSPNFIPPQITYRFHATGFPRLDILLTDLLLDEEPDPARRGFPVTQGDTYTLRFELSQQIVPAALSIRILDAQGVRYFGVNDWRPAGTSGAQIFEDGYGGLNGDGDLQVLYSDGGCGSQAVDPLCYAEWTNRRLDVLIGLQGPLGLWSGQSGTLGNWHVRVHKAARVVAQAGCFESLVKQNGVSFTLERVGLR